MTKKSSKNKMTAYLNSIHPYVNLTDIWRKSNKSISVAPSQWRRQEQALVVAKDIASEHRCSIEDLFWRTAIKGLTSLLSFPDLVEHYMKYLDTTGKQSKEKLEQIKLLSELPYSQSEVVTTNGKIDILTPEEIIEIKVSPSWKEGVGQLLVYGLAYPNHNKRLHLFSPNPRPLGKRRYKQIIDQEKALQEITKVCSTFNIRVTTEATEADFSDYISE